MLAANFPITPRAENVVLIVFAAKSAKNFGSWLWQSLQTSFIALGRKRGANDGDRRKQMKYKASETRDAPFAL